MDDTFGFPVYFECDHSQLATHRTRVETYFRVRRKSGGGECGQLCSVDEKTHCVAFRCQEDQQRVLKNSPHELTIGGSSLVLVLRDSVPGFLPPEGEKQLDTPPPLPDAPTAVEKPEGEHEEAPRSAQLCPENPSELPQSLCASAAGQRSEDQEDELTGPPARRIILLGKTGSGKSSLANTLLGEETFQVTHSSISTSVSPNATTKRCHGRSLTLIDSCGFFNTHLAEAELRVEMARCMTECAPGPHAFLIVLKVEKFTEQENSVVAEIQHGFSDQAFAYAVVVFTHGNQLRPGTTIQEFVRQNQQLQDLVRKCGGRCHVVDNTYWTGGEEGEYRSNRFQVEELLRSVEMISQASGGRCYSNEMLKRVETEISQQEELLGRLDANATKQDRRNLAKSRVFDQLLIRLSGITSAMLVGALVGASGVAASQLLAGRSPLSMQAGSTFASAAVMGGLTKLQLGYNAGEEAKSPREAAKKAAEGVLDQLGWNPKSSGAEF